MRLFSLQVAVAVVVDAVGVCADVVVVVAAVAHTVSLAVELVEGIVGGVLQRLDIGGEDTCLVNDSGAFIELEFAEIDLEILTAAVDGFAKDLG